MLEISRAQKARACFTTGIPDGVFVCVLSLVLFFGVITFDISSSVSLPYHRISAEKNEEVRDGYSINRATREAARAARIIDQGMVFFWVGLRREGSHDMRVVACTIQKYFTQLATMSIEP